MNTKRFNWGMTTEPEPGLDGRIMNLPRGKGLGGSSSINGMCWVRGNPMDYELWSALGADGWHWSNVLPYFQRLENADHAGDLRGRNGPISVRPGAQSNPLYRAFVEAGKQAGYAVSDNMNSLQHEGFGPMEMSVGNGERSSAAVGYLHPAVKRGNVRVIKHALVDRLVIKSGRVDGVLFSVNGRAMRAQAGRDVVLSAGSIMTPTILQRSGIGPAADLKEHGIEVHADQPHVGGNLMDHLEIYLQMECTQPVSLYSHMNAFGKARLAMQWMITRTGLGATNHFESGGHIRSRAGIVYPDIQYHFLPLAISYDGQSMAKGHGFQVHVGTKRSKSRGWVRLRSAAPQDLPRVCFNYMTHPDDWLEMRACIRLTREIFKQPAFAPYSGRELAPGSDCVEDAAIDRFLKEKVESAYHPCGTCRMGLDDDAPVDPRTMALKGFDGLRIVDSSVLPQATAGDLNAPTLVMAERASDLVKGKTLPSMPDAPILADPNWDKCQRSPDITFDYANDRDALRAALLQNAK
jgi:choline dehydrogenase